MKTRERIIWLMMVLGVLGFFVASYLTFKHFLGEVPSCSLLSGCEIVTTSLYSELFGLPISLFGSLYFLSVIVLLLALIQSKNLVFEKWAGIIIATGALISVFLLGAQVFELKAVCVYCLTSDIISIVLLFLFFIKRRDNGIIKL